MLKFTKELHKTITYKPDCIAYMVSLIKDEYKNEIKQASLSTIINSGLNYQRTISYSKLKNQYQITKSMKKYYEGWNVNLNSKDKKTCRTSIIISIENQKMLKILKKETKIITADLITPLFITGIKMYLKGFSGKLEDVLIYNPKKENTIERLTYDCNCN